MAISSTVKTIIPYIKQAGNYVKLMISSRAVKMENGNDLETELNSKFIVDKINFGSVTVDAHTATNSFTIPSKSGYSIASVTPTVNDSWYGYYSSIYNGSSVCFTNNHSSTHTNTFGAIVFYLKK